MNKTILLIITLVTATTSLDATSAKEIMGKTPEGYIEYAITPSADLKNFYKKSGSLLVCNYDTTICQKEFDQHNEQNMHRHIRAVHLKEHRYGCPIEGCKYNAASKATLTDHHRTHTQERFLCSLCKTTLSGPCTFRNHYKRNHPHEWEKHLNQLNSGNKRGLHRYAQTIVIAKKKHKLREDDYDKSARGDDKPTIADLVAAPAPGATTVTPPASTAAAPSPDSFLFDKNEDNHDDAPSSPSTPTDYVCWHCDETFDTAEDYFNHLDTIDSYVELLKGLTAAGLPVLH
jgi:hypothetical protein